MQLLNRLSFGIRPRGRPAKIWKPTHYQALPYYQKPIFIDVHDTYTKRSKEEIRAELENKAFTIEFEFKKFDETDIHRHEKDRRAKAYVDIEQFEFTELQLERFKLLVGPRYKEGKTEVKFTCEMFKTYQENYDKLVEQIHEVVIDAKRAP